MDFRNHVRIAQLILFTGKSTQSEELTWGSHVNKSFTEAIEAVYAKDKVIIDKYTSDENLDRKFVKSVFIYPFGICANFVEYDPDKDFTLRIRYDKKFTFEDMFVFITDPAMLTHSSIDQQSHQGREIFGLKKGHYTILNVEVVIKDSDNPTERDSCSLSPYEDCLDQQTIDIFAEVNTYTKIKVVILNNPIHKDD